MPISNDQTGPRRILLAVTGLSPQIVTETLYALAVASKQPWIPHEIRLLTTTEGAERARLALLSEEPGWFARLVADYRLPAIQFDQSSIVTVRDAAGKSLDDIRTPEDNERVADLITETVRTLTESETELHVSIAGGRKTMGFYLGYALSLFGRAQDRLSHVLVNEPFESSWDFFYPTPYSRVITTRGDKLADTRDGRVSLAEIPFVSLRDGLPTRLREGAASYSQTVAAAKRAMLPPVLRIDLEGGLIEAGGERFKLADADFGFYAWFAHRRAQDQPPIRWDDEVEIEEFLEFYEARCGRCSQRVETLRVVHRDGIEKEWFEQRLSKTNHAVYKALGDILAKPYIIVSQGKRPKTRYGFTIDPDAIRFETIEGMGDD